MKELPKLILLALFASSCANGMETNRLGLKAMPIEIKERIILKEIQQAPSPHEARRMLRVFSLLTVEFNAILKNRQYQEEIVKCLVSRFAACRFSPDKPGPIERIVPLQQAAQLAYKKVQNKLQHAILANDTQHAKHLLSYFSHNPKIQEKKTALLLAVERNNPDLVRHITGIKNFLPFTTGQEELNNAKALARKNGYSEISRLLGQLEKTFTAEHESNDLAHYAERRACIAQLLGPFRPFACGFNY